MFILCLFSYLVKGILYLPSDDKKKLSISGYEETITADGVSTNSSSEVLEEVEVENGIIGIGSGSFLGYKNLKSVMFPINLKTLHSDCFKSCSSLRSLEFKNGLQTISSMAFAWCSLLENITFPSSLSSVSQSNVFIGCSKLRNFFVAEGGVYSSSADHSVLIRDRNIGIAGPGAYKVVKIPPEIQTIKHGFINSQYTVTSIQFATNGSLQRIEDQAFRYASITRVEYPEGLLYLGGNVLSECPVKYVKIPKSLKEYGSGVFSPLPDQIEITDGCEGMKKVEGIIYNGNLTEIIMLPTSTSSMVIQKSIQKVEISTLQNCRSLSNLTTEENHPIYWAYKNILYTASKTNLLGCPGGVREAYVAESCKIICSSAFYGATLDFIRFEGRNVSTISSSVFRRATLSRLEIPEGVSTIQSWSIGSIKEVIFPSTLSNLYNEAADGTNMKIINLSICKKLKTINKMTFSNGDSVHTVILAPNLESIHDNAFQNLAQLKEILFPASLRSIGDSCFKGCKLLKKVTFEGNNLTSISNGAFQGCSFESIILSTNLRVLEQNIFAENTVLRTVNISQDSMIEEIQMDPFRGCHSIERLYFGRNLRKIPGGCFTDMNSLKRIEVSDKNEVYASSDGVVYTKDFECLIAFPCGRDSYAIHPDVQKFGESAFYKSIKLTELRVEGSTILK